MVDPLAESHSAEAIQAAAVHAEAVEKSRQVQIKSAISEELTSYFESRTAQGRFIDINRIPFICDDIRGIHENLGDLKTNFMWIKWLLGGFVVAAGMLAMKALGV